MNQAVRPRIAASACPHDCPSTCALEIEVFGNHTIGRVRGAEDNAYTAGVICAKVARYAERVHHPDRLKHPLRRTGAKGSGAIRADLLGRRARSCRREIRPRRTGAWLRSGLAVPLRRHDGLRHARRHPSSAPRQEIFRLFLHHLRQSGLDRLHRRHRQTCRHRSARNGEVRPGRDLGHQCGEHPGQRDDARDPRPQRARRQDRRRRCLHEWHDAAGRSAGADPARHRRRARLRGDALPVPRRQSRLGLSRSLHRRAARARRASAHTRSAMGVADHRLPGGNDRSLRPPRRREQTRLFPSRLRIFALAQRRDQHACGKLHRRGHRRVAPRRRRRLSQQRRHLPPRHQFDRRHRPARSRRSACSTSRASAPS